jgi:alpha-glucosidase
LPQGKTFRLTSFEDSLNAGHQAMDYDIHHQEVKHGDVLHVTMVRHGGRAAPIEYQ